MRQYIFSYPEFQSRRAPAKQLIASPLPISNFESRAFNALWVNRSRLGLKALWKCENQRTDGIAELLGGETLLLEMKTTLGWGSFHSACGQMLMAKQTLGIDIFGGIILFSEFDRRWKVARNGRPWDQFYLHAGEIGDAIRIDALQVTGNDVYFGPYAMRPREGLNKS
jgi:hypothetical protein